MTLARKIYSLCKGKEKLTSQEIAEILYFEIEKSEHYQLFLTISKHIKAYGKIDFKKMLKEQIWNEKTLEETSIFYDYNEWYILFLEDVYNKNYKNINKALWNIVNTGYAITELIEEDREYYWTTYSGKKGRRKGKYLEHFKTKVRYWEIIK